MRGVKDILFGIALIIASGVWLYFGNLRFSPGDLVLWAVLQEIFAATLGGLGVMCAFNGWRKND